MFSKRRRPTGPVLSAFYALRKVKLKEARMDATKHEFYELFQQLGLPSSEADIRAFIQGHRPLPGHVKITEAPFWTEAQAELLKDLLLQDADWAEVVDQLNLALH